MTTEKMCSRCWFAPVVAKGLCGSCYAFRSRTGKDRPAEMILKHIDRTLEAEQEAKYRHERTG